MGRPIGLGEKKKALGATGGGKTGWVMAKTGSKGKGQGAALPFSLPLG